MNIPVDALEGTRSLAGLPAAFPSDDIVTPLAQPNYMPPAN